MKKCWCDGRVAYAEVPVFDHGLECTVNPFHDPLTRPTKERALADYADDLAVQYHRMAVKSLEAAGFYRERARMLRAGEQ